ncbi:triose-phosphate isomerase [Clostridium niameyense]|uniref:Triosephosphate isomerase n=1 Tax=Clostridium niameyense TaxID=1622073 RepID=A0A6M0RA20_9CLOT|nr:triose-phosphate isomerase [Clostridium niameyense]NEZ47111.1 triose-phosphate isomerase [Clostridium niameyense]
MRTPIIAGNWKMNKTVDEAVELVRNLKPLVKDAKCDVVVCPTFVCLPQVLKEVEGTNIKVGAQNMHFEESGAYTGEISPSMLDNLGVNYVIIGHSERRQYFNETDETINKKVKKAFEHNLIPIVCCGESLEEREGNITEKVLEKQIKEDLKELTNEQVERLVVAYEPIWAIGTGKTATDDQANETIGYIRSVIEGMYGKEVAEKVRIQYGGSVKPNTIKAQMEKPEIDGALVGGASLKAEDFAAIVNF